MATSTCTNCGTSLTANMLFCPQCKNPTPYSGISPFDPTDSPIVLKDPKQKVPTQYGSPPYGAPQQNPYGSSDPYGGSIIPPPPPRRLSPGLLVLLVVLALLLIVGGGGIIYFFGVYQPNKMHADATATAVAQSTSTAQANATATRQAQATAQAQANATATRQTQATAQAQANATATAIVIGPPIGFTVTSLHSGQQVPQNTVLMITGTYSSEGSGHVWVVLEDSYANFYLQNPPVQFNGGGTWIATHVNPGPGITMVNFVYVTAAGNAAFQRKVANGDFGAFSPLPDGSQVLQAIPIQVT